MLRTVLGYLRRVLPWIAFGTASTAGWQWGALAGLVVSLVSLARERRRGVPADALVLDIGTTLYFTALTAISFSDPASPIQAYIGALPFVVLTVTAWAGIAVRHPFTLAIARQRVPEPLAGSHRFVRSNTIISTAWAVGFTVGAVGGVLSVVTGPSVAVMMTCQAIGVAGPALFTVRHSRRARRPQCPVTAA
ncbi:hypothetical protein [Amycolatopsis sp. RTGN1]|uniref:hypothetical protein n=1 Tax=Amycolatopsis ponsaeliensis TaxID=2992142 RepID=UPI00254F2390|nr:hypothetical protein [Amycolatopsis sp. RTGN1]